jgi:hypothetical protein
MDCALQIFKIENQKIKKKSEYRFAVVDNTKAKKYPANFVCILPRKLERSDSKNINNFANVFGEKSTAFAVDLLNKALITEYDNEVRIEIEKRLTLLSRDSVEMVQCSECKRSFQKPSNRKYKHPFCNECYRKRLNYNHFKRLLCCQKTSEPLCH